MVEARTVGTDAGSRSDAEVMIGLQDISKRYPGGHGMAVEELSMDIRAGEFVVFVGPSGCGKTTTMKMINRIIEPSAGRIFLEGEDVSDVNPDKLRRRIGYVIQQIGLFPHMTIADNIAVVPRMLGWDKQRIDDRIDELMETVSIPPSEFRDRYPKALSGGQRQRIGVARAMAADPPVLLMDEPFGAIDPITRASLQDEFLRLQEQIQKTIVFVTHDIDEAIKMGDRIAILKERSQIAQFASPEEILTQPANDFVVDFIGAGATLKRLSLSAVEVVPGAHWAVGGLGDATEKLRESLAASPRDWILLLDDERRPRRWASARDLEGEQPDGQPVKCILKADISLYEALDAMILSSVGCATIIDAEGRYQKVIDFDALRETIAAFRGDGQVMTGEPRW